LGYPRAHRKDGSSMKLLQNPKQLFYVVMIAFLVYFAVTSPSAAKDTLNGFGSFLGDLWDRLINALKVIFNVRS
jgi:hypothetical protein